MTSIVNVRNPSAISLQRNFYFLEYSHVT